MSEGTSRDHFYVEGACMFGPGPGGAAGANCASGSRTVNCVWPGWLLTATLP
jgi:hypothetical protein